MNSDRNLYKTERKDHAFTQKALKRVIAERDAFREAAMDAKTTLETWEFEVGLTTPESHQLERLRKLLPSPANDRHVATQPAAAAVCKKDPNAG